MSEPTLKVTDLVVSYRGAQGPFLAVDHVSLEAYPGETLAVVGESGCGKTTLARTILGLQAPTSGSVEVNSKREAKRSILAERIGMVWQDPFASLDPRWTIAKTLEEPFRLAGKKPDIEPLALMVGLNSSVLPKFPHQLSGGQRQRVAIGRALALRPPLLICDEPTAALDLSIQAQILNLIRDIQKQTQSTVLYISHDLGTVRFLADRVVVMQKGKVVEQGRTQEVFGHPKEAYTRELMGSALSLENLGWLPGDEPVAR